MGFTTVIFAAGKWSRMQKMSEEKWILKHLFPLWEKNITSRLIRQVQDFSERVVCIVWPGQGALFQENLRDTPAEIIENTGEWFMPLFEILYKKTQWDVLITTWDLVFSDTVVEKTLPQLKAWKTQLVTDKEWGRKIWFPIRFALMRHELLWKISGSSFSPEKISSVLSLLVWDIIDNGFPRFSTVETLANLNTPEDYEALLRKFKQEEREV